ncbi:MAG TPA: ABC transporter ATP-binding protein [Bacteroidia bacterium]|jgi:phospholipid/cholesterol/gamma-HCH transport system ATP-binding protein|nr:ABC transporter ATP-binding protein [Bacteroidia bacterium]
MEAAVAEVEHLKKSFGSNDVLKDINLKIEKGENLVVFGKSGSGKSVFIKCLVGLVEPDDGKVILFGKDISGLKNEELNLVRKKVGFLFQSAALYDSMTVRENLEFPLRDVRSKTKNEIDELVKEALKNVGLEDAAEKMPAELSGGMRKRIGLARTLILKPELILYDEPTTGLDPITSKEISQLILDVQKKFHAASIIITHDVDCARITANRMMVIKDGTPVAEGSFKELSESKNEWVHSFFE